MPSDTVSITTPIKKHKVVIKATVTGLDQEKIDSVFYTEPAEGETARPAQQRANRMSLDVLLVSIDGKTDNLADTAMAMDVRDYNFIVEKLNERTNPLPDKKK